MTEPEQAPEASTGPGAPSEQPSGPDATSHTPRASQGEAPLYKGEPLDSERGPGLGCFWIQVIFLGVLLVLTPLTVIWAWPAEVSAILLIVTLLLLLFAGQTVIFLLRLVAADRRSRRVPRSASARQTVGMLEDQANTAAAPHQPDVPDDAAVPDGAAESAADEPADEPAAAEPADEPQEPPTAAR